MVKDGFWYAFGLVLVAGAVWAITGVIWLILPPLLLALFALWFFRDPERAIPQGPGLIVSPADGIVTEAEWVETTLGSRLRVSIFLNVFDVHVNRVPISGIVTVVDYREGSFLNAGRAVSAIENEQTMIVVKNDECEVAFKQIAGLIARRIICNLKVGDTVERGARMGMIKFGSRCDVLIPAEANLKVGVGKRVTGGKTILATLPSADSEDDADGGE
jgi:phosphatidylserine decarboxylase